MRSNEGGVTMPEKGEREGKRGKRWSSKFVLSRDEIDKERR
jgi:hypothetical protein